MTDAGARHLETRQKQIQNTPTVRNSPPLRSSPPCTSTQKNHIKQAQLPRSGCGKQFGDIRWKLEVRGNLYAEHRHLSRHWDFEDARKHPFLVGRVWCDQSRSSGSCTIGSWSNLGSMLRSVLASGDSECQQCVTQHCEAATQQRQLWSSAEDAAVHHSGVRVASLPRFPQCTAGCPTPPVPGT